MREKKHTDMSPWDWSKHLTAQIGRESSLLLGHPNLSEEETSTARPVLLISLVTYSHTGIIRAILGYCFLLVLFWQCGKSVLDLDIPRCDINVWKKLIRQISFGKTSETLQPLGLKGKNIANDVSIPLDDWHGKY